MANDPNSNAIAKGVCGRIAGEARHKSVSIVDLGCGDGRVLSDLQSDGFGNLTGLGWRITVPDGAHSLEEVDLASPGWARRLDGQRFDWVVSTEVLEHLVNPYQFLVEARQLLADDGRLILTFPNVHNWRSIVGYAVGGRFSGFFGPNWNDGHPLFDQHIFIPNQVRYFLDLVGFELVAISYLHGRGRLLAMTTMMECRLKAQE